MLHVVNCSILVRLLHWCGAAYCIFPLLMRLLHLVKKNYITSQPTETSVEYGMDLLMFLP